MCLLIRNFENALRWLNKAGLCFKRSRVLIMIVPAPCGLALLYFLITSETYAPAFLFIVSSGSSCFEKVHARVGFFFNKNLEFMFCKVLRVIVPPELLSETLFVQADSVYLLVNGNRSAKRIF
jgi:hypothetical protein